MVQVCVGCGLTTDADGSLIVDGAGSWGVAPLAFPAACAQTSGMPIYCDSNGELRAPPPFGAVAVANFVDETPGINHNLGTGDEHYSPQPITYTNPSPCRSMLVLAMARGEFGSTVSGGTTYRMRFGNPVINVGSGGGDIVFRETTDDDHASHVVEVQGVSSGFTTLAPGASLSITTGMTTECLNGSMTVNRHEYTVHAIGVYL